MSLLRTLLLICIVVMTNGQGSMKLCINQRSVDIINNLVARTINENLPQNSFTDITGNASFSFLDVGLNRFSFSLDTLTADQSTLTVLQPNLVSYDANMMDGNISGNFSLTTSFVGSRSSISIYQGPFKANLKKVHVSVNVSLTEEGGYLRACAGKHKCMATISDIEVVKDQRAQTGLVILEALLNNVFKHRIAEKVCLTLRNLLTSSIVSLVGDGADEPVDILGVGINLDLVKQPKAVETNGARLGHIEAVLNGKCFPVSDPNITYNFEREMLPDCPQSNAMINVILGNYLFRTMIAALYETGIFNQNVDLDTVPLPTGLTLDSNFLRIIAPKLGNLGFTGLKPLRVGFSAIEAPDIKLTPVGIYAQGQFILSVSVINDLRENVEGANRSAIFAFSLSTNLSLSGSISIKNNAILPLLNNLNFTLSIRNGEPVDNLVNVNVLQLIIGSAKSAILTAVNDLFAGGIQIPVVFGFGLTNLQLSLTHAAAIINADVNL